MKNILSALDGHKFQLGVLFEFGPDAINQLVNFLNALVPIFTAFHMDGAIAVTAKVVGALLMVVGGAHKVWKILSQILKNSPPTPPDLKSGALTGALVLALLPTLAAAQDIPPAKPATEAALSCGAMRFAERGSPDHEDFVCRLSLAVPAPSGLTLFGRADYTRTQTVTDGEGLFDIKTFRSIEAFAGGRKLIAPNLEATAFSGVSWDRDDRIEPTDPRLWTVAGGLRYNVPKRGYLIVAAGHHGPVGGTAFLGSVVYDLSAGASWFGDIAVPLGATRFKEKPYTVRFGVSARIKSWKF